MDWQEGVALVVGGHLARVDVVALGRDIDVETGLPACSHEYSMLLASPSGDFLAGDGTAVLDVGEDVGRHRRGCCSLVDR